METSLRLKVLIFELADRCVRYIDTTLGSVGIDLKPCFAQNIPKSLKVAVMVNASEIINKKNLENSVKKLFVKKIKSHIFPDGIVFKNFF